MDAIVGFYLGLNALLMLALAYNVGARRGRQGALDPGATGDAGLTRAIRAHGNFAEFAALCLMLLAGLRWLGYPASALHAYGATFTLGRIAHAAGMMRDRHPNALRFIGNLTTGLCLLIGGFGCILPILRP